MVDNTRTAEVRLGLKDSSRQYLLSDVKLNLASGEISVDVRCEPTCECLLLYVV